MSDNKKKQAMSLLFGDAPDRPGQPDTQANAPNVDSTTSSRQVAKTTRQKSAPSSQRLASDVSASRTGVTPPRESGGGERPATAPGSTPDPYYQGASRYRRRSGDQVKHSIYFDAEVSRALKMAAAMGEDARGTNVSAIVNQALRELGYGK